MKTGESAVALNVSDFADQDDGKRQDMSGAERPRQKTMVTTRIQLASVCRSFCISTFEMTDWYFPPNRRENIVQIRFYNRWHAWILQTHVHSWQWITPHSYSEWDMQQSEIGVERAVARLRFEVLNVSLDEMPRKRLTRFNDEIESPSTYSRQLLLASNKHRNLDAKLLISA